MLESDASDGHIVVRALLRLGFGGSVAAGVAPPPAQDLCQPSPCTSPSRPCVLQVLQSCSPACVVGGVVVAPSVRISLRRCDLNVITRR